MAVPTPKPKKVAPRATSRSEPQPTQETSGLSLKQKQALQDEINAVNARITFLKSMGANVRAKTGLLYMREPLVVHQTGAKGTIEHSGKGFYLHVDGKDHNSYIKQMGGKWRSFNSSWLLPGSALGNVRASFVITSETTLPPREDIELTFVVREEEREDGESDILVTGSKAPGKEYTLKLKEMGGRFEGRSRSWRLPKDKLEEVQELLGDLIVEEEVDPVIEE